MSQGFFASARVQYVAFSVAAREGLRIFRSLCSTSASPGSFEPLTPVLIKDDQFERYDRELRGALNNDEVLNIALTGGYGAGKSSVLKTFFERHPEFRTAHVSLATFSKDAPSPLPVSDAESDDVPAKKSQPAQDSGEIAKASDLIARIEETIVQQLLYSVPAARLPKTRLKRIVQTSRGSVLRRTIFLAAMIIAGARLYVPTLKDLPSLDPAWLVTSLMMIPAWAAVAGVGLGGLYLLYSTLKMLSMFSIDGLTLKGGKLEAIHHGSVLHKNVDEIIYCFERSDIRVVVIEDLDRFGTQEVFFRLREINFTIKQSPQITRPIHFIYAIRDELFSVTDKTKFFDLIIPVIPVVNSENSREKLYELMKGRDVDGSKLGAELDPILVETVCYYIDEMRLIKNIVNEYDIFASLLSHGGLKLDQNKLFAIVVFRNLYPEEFSELSKRRGKVYSLLTGLSKWVALQAESLSADVEKLQNEKTVREQMVLESLVDLRLRVWFEVVKTSGVEGMNYIRIDRDRMVDLSEFTKDETFEEIRGASRWEGVAQAYNANRGPIINPKEPLEKTSYARRAKQLESRISEIDEAVSVIEKSLFKLRTLSFQHAAKTDYGSVIAKQLPEMDAVVYLMRAGYLDTDYTDYLGFFYEGSLTREDQNMILALRRHMMLDVATPVRNPGRVIGKLEHDVLDEGQGIIAGLIAELSVSAPLNDSSDERTQKLAVILQSGQKHLSRLAAAALILLGGEARVAFIHAIRVMDSYLLTALLETDEFEGPDNRQDLVCAVMDSLSQKQLKALVNAGSLARSISGLTQVDALMPGMESNTAGWSWLRREPVRFNSLGDKTAESTLRKLVEWGCLEPTFPMLSLLCTAISGEVGDVSYHRMQSFNLIGLELLVEQDPDSFIMGLLGQPGKVNESSQSLRYLLSLFPDDTEVQEDIFHRTDCKIDELAGFPDNIWKLALQRDRVSHVAQAGWDYYKHMLVRATEPPSEAISDKERADIDEIFIAFLARNPLHAQGLWDVEGADVDELQAYLLASTLSNASLDQIFSRTTVGPGAIIGLNMPAARSRYLASAAFVPFHPDLQEAFANISGVDEATYLLKRWAAAREAINLRTLDPQVGSLLSSYPMVPIGDLIQIWEGLVEREVADDAAVIGKLASICARANAEGKLLPGNCRPIIVKRAADASVPLEDRLELLHHALTLHCDWPATASILASLGGGYEELLTATRSVRIPHTLRDGRVAQALHLRGFVGKVKPGKEYIEVFNKRLGRG